MESTITINTIIVMSLLRQATEVWKIKMLWHPHGYSRNTPFVSAGQTVSTCSEWMESNTKKMWFYPPRTECITHWNQHHDLEWQNT